MKTADLHFHTHHSDGKHSVAWVTKQLEEAQKNGLTLAVLTDHDGVAGYLEFKKALPKGMSPVCASELSCTFYDEKEKKERELHLLMYGIDPLEPEIQNEFKRFRDEREKRFFRICEKINKAGYPLDAEAFAKKHPGVLGRPHVADALIEAGIVQSRQEAFEKFLADSKPFYVKKWRFPLADATAYAKKHGCKTSVAHPGQYGFKESQIEYFKSLGVDALEIFHPRHTQDDMNFYNDCIKKYGFFMSGGSDFHAQETDQVGTYPSVGRTQYPYENAKKFLGDLL